MKPQRPKKKSGIRAKSPNPAQSVAPLKPSEHAGTTKNNSRRPSKEQTLRQWRKNHIALLKALRLVVYQNTILVARAMVWIIRTRHEEIIQILMLLLVIYLQHQAHTAHLFQR